MNRLVEFEFDSQLFVLSFYTFSTDGFKKSSRVQM